MNILILRTAVKIHHAMIAPARFITDSSLEKSRTSAMEMFVGKAYQYGLDSEIQLSEGWTDGQINALKEAYSDLIKLKRYRIKSELIDRYYFNQIKKIKK